MPCNYEVLCVLSLAPLDTTNGKYNTSIHEMLNTVSLNHDPVSRNSLCLCLGDRTNFFNYLRVEKVTARGLTHRDLQELYRDLHRSPVLCLLALPQQATMGLHSLS